MPHPDAEPAALLLTETAYAKINLALHVRGRRSDGYHELESLFVFAQDGDILEAEKADELTLIVEGPFAAALAGDTDNLVLRAARALQDAAGCRSGARLRLGKRLPVASGIGGGSADAAAALRLLMRLWNVALPDARLLQVALALGSDIPACIASRTQYVGGRGETLMACAPAGLDGAPMLLVNPGVALSTGTVFAAWDRVDRGALDVEALNLARNDLERPAVALVPAIADVLDALRARSGLRMARMSGSGATCFALFDTQVALERARAAMQGDHPEWWTMATRIRPV